MHHMLMIDMMRRLRKHRNIIQQHHPAMQFGVDYLDILPLGVDVLQQRRCLEIYSVARIARIIIACCCLGHIRRIIRVAYAGKGMCSSSSSIPNRSDAYPLSIHAASPLLPDRSLPCSDATKFQSISPLAVHRLTAADDAFGACSEFNRNILTFAENDHLALAKCVFTDGN